MHNYCRYSVSQYWYISVTFKIIQVSKEKDIGVETGEYLYWEWGMSQEGSKCYGMRVGHPMQEQQGTHDMQGRSRICGESGGAVQVCRRVNGGKGVNLQGWRKVRGKVTRARNRVSGWDKRFTGFWSYMQGQKRESQMVDISQLGMEKSRVGIIGWERVQGRVSGTITGRDRQINRHEYKVICL